MLWVVALLTVGGMYLAVNAKVARAGRLVLSLEARRSELQRLTSELTAELAEITSPGRMLERATAMGFRPVRPDQIEYIPVEGYAPESAFVAPQPPASPGSGEPRLSPAYTETLGEWIQGLLRLQGGDR